VTGDAEWLLIIDAPLNPRLATELFRRGRMALSLQQLGVKRLSDPALLRYLHLYWPLATLVTFDDHMPEEHAQLLARWQLTIAVVDPLFSAPYTQEQWKHEVVHRWAHKMQKQRRGTILRYSVRAGGRVWTRPRHPAGPPSPRLPATLGEEPEHHAGELEGRTDEGQASHLPLGP
jgi:hypothetical protein